MLVSNDARRSALRFNLMARKAQKEQEIKRGIADYLRLKRFLVINHRNVGIYKKATGTYIPLPQGELGISDVIACAPSGRFVAIEVKAATGKLSDHQRDFLREVRDRGGIGIVAFSLDDVVGKLCDGA